VNPSSFMNAVEVVAAGLPEAQRDAFRAARGINILLREVLTRVKQAWPALGLSDEAFLQALGEHLAGETDIAARLSTGNLGDLYLATACAKGEPAALLVLEEQFLTDVTRTVAHVRGMNADDVRGAMTERLLVQHGDQPPRIAEYSGRGSLRGWLQVVATRVSLSLQHDYREIPNSELERMDMGSADPVLDRLKQKYRSEFSAAFSEAFRAALPRDRNLLRQHYIDGLTGDELAALHRVHRATAVRWLASARQKVFSATRDAMAKRLSIPADEFPSVLRLIRSELRVSLSSMQ
jgi:RNA polymerase sigma-70 factor, ECF subfamily